MITNGGYDNGDDDGDCDTVGVHVVDAYSGDDDGGGDGYDHVAYYQHSTYVAHDSYVDDDGCYDDGDDEYGDVDDMIIDADDYIEDGVADGGCDGDDCGD